MEKPRKVHHDKQWADDISLLPFVLQRLFAQVLAPGKDILPARPYSTEKPKQSTCNGAPLKCFVLKDALVLALAATKLG